MKKRVLLLCMTCLLGAGMMTGCRQSMKITKILYDQQSKTVDKDNDTKIVKDKDKQKKKDDKIPEKKRQKTEKKNHTKKQKTEKKTEVAGTSGKTSETSTKSTDNSDTKKTTSGKGSSKKGKKSGKKGTTTKGNSNKGSRGNNTAGLSDDPNARQVYDDNGNVVNLPSKVDTVVAPGEAGVFVQMLGGKNVLAGTSKSVLTSLTKSIFADEGISKAATYWDGDGDTAMSDANFKKLLKAKPSLCVGISGQTNFTNKQVKKLEKNGIGYITIPELNTVDNVENAAEILGEAIGNRSSKGGQNAKKVAKKYINYCDDLANRVKNKCGVFSWNGTDYNNDLSQNAAKTVKNASDGYYTLYVDGWDSGAKLRFTLTDGTAVYSETGAAIVPNGYSASPLSYYLSIADVDNNAAHMSPTNPTYYIGMPLNINVVNHSVSGTGLSYYKPTNESFTRAWLSSDTYYCLGDDKFPAVIVDSKATKSKLKNSKAWKYYGKTTLGNRTEYGFTSHNSIVISYIHAKYDIVVNPHGAASWTEGSPESVLESIWAGWQISGKYSKSEVTDEIRTFYKNYYRCNLTGSQLNKILAGQ